ncbi:uncharacterized protein RCC_00408 [Ramularia collo-cygni]|uniref:CFEM domain-containing protein n=1 Tax=Ramularia collo-cygni TaxID=112498 RepID=A0A2D3ULX3_9PEZI|nr:uncharacterized protein RCC_00408 [Ramularia collo-cygni]CZT14431.1 uncharacterized protein RCC_00408 [Ramularia collo-cygni]
MRVLAALLVAGLSVASANLFSPGNETTATALQQIQNQTDLPLPNCAGLCFVQVLPEYSCSPDDISCICPNANLTTSLSACFTSNCTIPDGLIAQKFSKDTCGAVSRDVAPITRGLTWGLFAFALIFVGARFLARPERLNGSGYGTDDWTILHCLVLLIPINVLVQTMTDNGLGTDAYQVPALRITSMLQQFFVFTILYCALVMVTRISILQLYLRIWREAAVGVWFRRTCWILIWVHVVTLFAYCISLVFQCTPVAYAWTAWDGLHKGTCVNRQGQLYSLGAINICYDVIVFVLPLHNFLKLNISWRRKTGVLTIFMVGLLVTICAVIRLQYLVKIGRSANPTWDYNSVVQWSSIEANFSVICTCMPAMAGLLQRAWAALSGNSISIEPGECKAPAHPSQIDPERAVGHEGMMHLRQVSDFDDSTTRFDSGDRSAPTTITQKSGDSDTLEMVHHAPRQATATDFTYRDRDGRMHEVKVIDRPTEDIEYDRNNDRVSKQEKALRDLQAARESPESPIERTDWNKTG